MTRLLYWHDARCRAGTPITDLVRSALAVRGKTTKASLRTPSWGGLLIIVDGKSGSGKTTLSEELMRSLQVAGCPDTQMLSLDSWYPGWGGLSGGQWVSEQIVMGNYRAYPRWDWEHSCVDHWVKVDSTRPTIIEGSGSLTPVTCERAQLSLWVEAPESRRKSRALDRDGDVYRPWWNTWALQEHHHMKAHYPRQLTDIEIRT